MNIKQLHSFLVVAQEHQITAAAKRLYTSQPPLSYQMKQLEKEVGCPLLKRTAHGIELTPQGQLFQQYAEKIVELANSAKRMVSDSANGMSGTIRIGLISSAAQAVINSRLQSLAADYPRVSIEITEGNTFELVKKINYGLLDLAIVRSPFNKVGVHYRELFDEQIVATFDSNYSHLLAGSVDLTALQEQPLIIYRRFEAIFNDGFTHHGIKPFYAVKCDDARTALLLAAQGMGIALVPASIANIYGHLEYSPVNYQPWHSTVQLIWPQNQELTPLIKRVIKLLSQHK